MFGIFKKKTEQKPAEPVTVYEDHRPANVQEQWMGLLGCLARLKTVSNPIVTLGGYVGEIGYETTRFDNGQKAFIVIGTDGKQYYTEDREEAYRFAGSVSDMLEEHLPEMEKYYESHAEYIRSSADLYVHLLEPAKEQGFSSQRRGTLANEEALFRSMCWRMNELYETTDWENDKKVYRTITDVQRARMEIFTEGFASTLNEEDGKTIRDLSQACYLFETFYWAYLKKTFFNISIGSRNDHYLDYVFNRILKLRHQLSQEMDKPKDRERWVLCACYHFLFDAMSLMPAFFKVLHEGIDSVIIHYASKVRLDQEGRLVDKLFSDEDCLDIAKKGLEKAFGMVMTPILKALIDKGAHSEEEIEEYNSLSGRQKLVQGLRYINEYSDEQRAFYRQKYAWMINGPDYPGKIIPPEAQE